MGHRHSVLLHALIGHRHSVLLHALSCSSGYARARCLPLTAYPLPPTLHRTRYIAGAPLAPYLSPPCTVHVISQGPRGRTAAALFYA
eukprot:scaffold4915_cov71-Phaeocystis_antarctica.AAC.1